MKRFTSIVLALLITSAAIALSDGQSGAKSSVHAQSSAVHSPAPAASDDEASKRYYAKALIISLLGDWSAAYLQDI